MKRRDILLGGTAVLAAPAILKFARPALADNLPDAGRLNGDLMPLGGERAGNASGTIPAWTGGCVKDVPAGWSGDTDPYGADKPVFSVTAANAEQYADMLCDGQLAMLKTYGSAGYRMDVYPTRRSACAPQYVYDNTYKNVGRALGYNGDLIAGVTGVVGGLPFPILSADPAVAGVQCMWNHELSWQGYNTSLHNSNWVMGNGQRSLQAAGPSQINYEYYDPSLTPETYSGTRERGVVSYLAPPNLAGGKFLAIYSTIPTVQLNVSYEYLVGEGRIRQAPEPQYDIPVSFAGDAVNFDELNVFEGKFDRYTWKLLGKKEMIVPYNQFKNNRVTNPEDLIGLQFFNPDLIRFEIHRCYIVEATLAPGARMTEPRRRFYVDEDTGIALMGDSWDDQGNFWKHSTQMPEARPDVPGVLNTSSVNYNLQEEAYFISVSFYNVPAPLGAPPSWAQLPASMFNPQSLANSGGL